MTWAPDYATTEMVRDYLNANGTGNRDETEIGWAISAASRSIDKVANRQFGLVASAEARYYSAEYDNGLSRWFVLIDDLMTTTGLVVATDPVLDESFTGAVGSDYVLMPRNAAAEGRPWIRLDIKSTATNQPVGAERLVKVTARWGWSSVPDPIVQATALQASRLLWRRDAPGGVAGSPESGSEVRLLARLDPDVLTIVRSFARMWVAR